MPDTLGVVGLVVVGALVLAAAISLVWWWRRAAHQERGQQRITEQVARMQRERAEAGTGVIRAA